MSNLRIEPPPQKIVSLNGTCFDYVPVISGGLWNLPPGVSIFQHALFRFNIQLILYFYVATFFHVFLSRLNIPKVCSEILAGFVLGETVWGISHQKKSKALVFNDEGNIIFEPNVILASFAKIGNVFIGFLTGVRMDPGLILKAGSTGPILGFLLAVFPQLMVITLQVKYNPDAHLSPSMEIARESYARTYMAMITSSQFIGVTYILMQLRITNSRLGHLALAIQLTSEIIVFIATLLRGFIFAWTDIKRITAIHTFVATIFFALVVTYILRPSMYYVIRKTPENRPIKKFYICMLVLMVFLVTIFSDFVGMPYENGGFLLGLLVPAGSPLARDVMSQLESFVCGMFIPILVTFVATKFNMKWFMADKPLLFIICCIGFLVKLAVTFGLCVALKMPVIDAVALALILNNKGIAEIGIILGGNVEYHDVESTSGILLILAAASVIPPLVKYLYDPMKVYIGHNKKCIQFTAPDTELSILACGHRQEDAMAAIKLLEFSNPSKGSPLSIYGLCLEELLASSTPVLINHQLGQKTNSTFGSRSQPSIDIFNYFQNQNKKLTHVHIFTAISYLKQMHEDICYLAFNKGVSMIILPFHMKWNSKTKKLIAGTNDMRNLNVDVLNRAPCSVAILVDRRGLPGLSSIFVTSITYRVGVVFIGGDDDREALAYALRMGGDSRVNLIVVRLVSDEKQNDRWENMLDTESLRNMRHEMADHENISYREENVNDGSDTASIIREMVESFDLIMVGRRHEKEPQALSGLSEWVELRELGPIGDILASPDIKEAVSVLVVQQQIMKASHSEVLN